MPIFDGTDTIYSNSFGLKVTSPVLKDSTVAYLEKLNSGETDSIDFRQLQLNDIAAAEAAVCLDRLSLDLVDRFGCHPASLADWPGYPPSAPEKEKGYFFTPPQVLPPHLRAIQELDRLKAAKIWQQGRRKSSIPRLPTSSGSIWLNVTGSMRWR